jgi:hypothetical protein
MLSKVADGNYIFGSFSTLGLISPITEGRYNKFFNKNITDKYSYLNQLYYVCLHKK